MLEGLPNFEPCLWAEVEGDDKTHVTIYHAWPGRTLCGKRITKFIVTAIPRPKVVDCEECIEEGAYNPLEPMGGYTASTHSAWRQVDNGRVIKHP